MHRHREDLGTVLENFRATLAAAGLWSYQVICSRRRRRRLISPDLYSRECAGHLRDSRSVDLRRLGERP